MNEIHESPQIPENQNVFNPYLNELINKCLNVAIPIFDKLNKQNNSDDLNSNNDPENKENSDLKYNEYHNNLDVIEAVADNSNLDYAVRGEHYDKDKNIYYINLSPKDQIDFNKTITDGVFAFKIDPDTKIKEVNIAIKPPSIKESHRFKGSSPNISKLFYQKDYLIDVSVREVSLSIDQYGIKKISFSERLAGLGIELYHGNSCSTFLKTYIGKEDFNASRNEVALSQTLSQKIYDFCSSKIPEPGKKF